VIKEGSTYAGLEESMAPTSDAEFAAEAYSKRLVEYDNIHTTCVVEYTSNGASNENN
jgi:hypothetical protein